jgi:murein DD-endopeptidase MepM/ murein hydrolase activator NlpD
MKHFYYFSKNKLKFVEIKNFYRKFIFLALFFSIITSFLVFSSYFVVDEIINPDSEVTSLQLKNRELSDKIEGLIAKYENFEDQLDQLSSSSNDLRLKVNLEPLTDEERNVGVGGSYFNDVIPQSITQFGALIGKLNSYVDEINAKLEIEKNNYIEIEKTLENNEKLYAAIPAIKPTKGSISDGFGMRMHPVLKIRRMHNGTDFVASIGTSVYAPGGGKVSFTGRRSGTGLTLEIDHGFGYKTLYGHLSKIIVKKGQTVKRGDFIAKTGNSGKLSTGPHLHYEVRHNGIALNPVNFIYDNVDLFEIAHVSQKDSLN